MTMTRSEMEAHILLNVGNRTDLGTYDTDWLNWALQDAASIRNWRDMKRPVANAIQTRADGLWYALPPDIKDLLNVTYIDGAASHPLTYKPPEMFDAVFPRPEATGGGIPQFYTWQGDWIKLYPIPSEDRVHIDIFAAFWPDEFDSDVDDENPLKRLDAALIAQATAYAFRAYREWERAIHREAEFFRLIKRYARSDGTVSDWTPQYASERLKDRMGTHKFVVPAAGVGETIPAATTYT